MYGVHAQFLYCGQEHRCQNDNGGTGIHDHAQKQEDDDQYRKDGPSGVEVGGKERGNCGGRLGEGQHTAERGGKGQHEGKSAVGLDG